MKTTESNPPSIRHWFPILRSYLAGGSTFLAWTSLTLASRILRTISSLAAGGFITVLVIGIYSLNARPDLSIWHTIDLKGDYTADSDVDSFEDYLALEERLFQELQTKVYQVTEPGGPHVLNRYRTGSPADPGTQKINWNRTFEQPALTAPTAGVLLLHGMSDSPYSMRSLGEAIHGNGAYVIGLRLPGHGTLPSGLTSFEWEDMAAAVELAMRHLKEKIGDRPLYIVGYSNGGALAVHYALESLLDESLPPPKGIVLLSPSIGVSPMAAFAVWQSRLGAVLGLDKLAWKSILPEYDPYKYVSFAINAGHQVYRLTNEISRDLDRLSGTGKLEHFPPVLAFQSVVDATVSTPALIEGLFAKLPSDRNELVLFDFNRVGIIESLIQNDPKEKLTSLVKSTDKPFSISLLCNRDNTDLSMEIRYYPKERTGSVVSDPGLSWPEGIYSLSHVALPFPPDDPLYGNGLGLDKRGAVYQIGNINLRGEKDVLPISPVDQLRLRWNPFYSYLQKRVLAFTGEGLHP